MFRNIGAIEDRSQPTERVACRLLDISEFYNIGRTPPSWDGEAIVLYSNPQEISRSLIASYGASSGLLSTNANLTYGHSNREPIKLNGSLVDTQCKNKDATKYLDQLENLTKPSINSSPSVLAIVWGARVIQPVVLTELTITEIAWANGLVSKADLGLTFQYLPPINYRASNDENRVKKLTEREIEKAKKLAAEEIDKSKKSGDKSKKTDPKKLNVNSSNGVVKNESGATIITVNRDQLSGMR
jgi:hypothetical protein